MRFSGCYFIDRGREELFEHLQDPTVLMKCIPGCEGLVRNPDGSFDARIEIKVGIFRGKFTGRVVLRDMVRPERYTMELEGRGRLGSLSGTTRIELRPIEASRTEIVYESEVRLGGLIASLGERFIPGGASEIPRLFFSSLERTLREMEGL